MSAFDEGATYGGIGGLSKFLFSSPGDVDFGSVAFERLRDCQAEACAACAVRLVNIRAV